MRFVVPYIGTWIETDENVFSALRTLSYLIQVRGLKPGSATADITVAIVVPYIGTWIETVAKYEPNAVVGVVPYIGTWIETRQLSLRRT